MIFSFVLFVQNGIYKDIGAILLILLNLIGIYIGYLLVQKQLHIQSNHADKICSLFSKSDCNNVLESSEAKFLGIIGWSELGLSYFISNIIISLIIPSLLPFLAMLNTFTIPYSLWSVWYQKFKVKQWCPLCLIVQILFWSILAVNLTFGYFILPHFSLANILLVGTVYSIPFFIISLLVSKLGEGKKSERISQEFNSFKMNNEVFSAMLAKQPYYSVDKDISSILFGNHQAPHLITIFTNPHCDPCARMHARVEKLLEKTRDKFCIQYIFTAFSEDLEISNKFLISIFKEKDTNEMLQIFNKWFSEGKHNKEEFLKLYPTSIDGANIAEEFEKHNQWKEVSKLRATPTILVNGYELLASYKIEDLIYLLN